jgi:methionine--tRNA ligase beta chain
MRQCHRGRIAGMPETFEDYIDRLLALTGNNDPLEVLSQTAPRMGALIAARSDAELRWTPSPDRWSVAQIVTHLADCEIVSGYRVRLILSASGTTLQPFDQNGWARALKYETSDAFASLTLFTALRESLLTLFGGLTPEQLDRFGMHPERGKETVRHLMRLYAGHDINHLQQIERLLEAQDRDGRAPRAFAPAAVKPAVSLEALQQIDVRVGTIRSVGKVAETDRLAVLSVDFGDRQRTIVAGIRAERSSPMALVGRQALFVVNLPPKTIRGQLSEGMLFDIGYEDGVRPSLATPERPVPDGARAG